MQLPGFVAAAERPREILAEFGQCVQPVGIHRARGLQSRDSGILGQLAVAAGDTLDDLHVVAGAQQIERGPAAMRLTDAGRDRGKHPGRGRAARPIPHDRGIRGGAAWLPAFLCQPDVVRGTLMELMPEESRGPIDIHALYTAQASTTPYVRAFVRFLTRIMEPLSLPAG